MTWYITRPVVVSADRFNPDASHWYDVEFTDGVRATNYAEVADICRTSGCSPAPEMWTWSVCGVIQSRTRKQLVCPGDWIVTFQTGEVMAFSDEKFKSYYVEEKA